MNFSFLRHFCLIFIMGCVLNSSLVLAANKNGREFRFGRQGKILKVFYHAELSNLINEELGDPEWDKGTLKILEFRTNNNLGNIYILQFNGAPSFEPTFQVFRKSKEGMVLVGDLLGEQIKIRDDNFLEVTKSSGEVIKYILKPNKLIRVKKRAVKKK
ncbi:hypothetical protein BVY03_02870 [bacterium K02(2017)]|nr:hypothetical protein BVY03_02870 [bacterium K02(2017)]